MEIDLESNEDATPVLDMESNPYQGAIMSFVMDKYYLAQRAREQDERRWLNAYHNYRGVYNKNIKFRESEKSRVFIKITKTKVVSAFGHLIDILFGTTKFPLEVAETEVPEGIAQYVQVDEDNKGNIRKPFTSLQEMVNAENPIKDFADRYQGIKWTVGADNPVGVTLQPAKKAAEFMNKLIMDQIDGSNGVGVVRDALFECVLLGTGVVKGPFTSTKQIASWDSDGGNGRIFAPKTKKIPKLESVSVWDMFIDPDATRMEDVSWVIQRHKMNKDQLRALAGQPLFNEDTIISLLKENPNYLEADYELEIRTETSNINNTTSRYEVLEYWGNVDKQLLLDLGMDVESESELYDEIPVNIWVCNGKIIRLILNPFQPHRIPYQIFSYENNPYSIYGVGVAENMEDSQMIMNGHARMAIDNLALSGSLLFDVDESALAPGQSFEIYPGKVFRRQAGQAGQAIFGLKFPNTSVENLQMFDKFRQLADESTGIPSYSHGQTGVQSTTRTAAGMSMLMGAASLSIKTVIKNIDENLLRPLGEALYNWNYAFYDGDLPIRGDLEVKATGTTSLMQKEIKTQRLTQLLQTAANPAIAPFVKMPNVIREIAKSLDLNPEDFINDPEQAKLYMMMMNGGVMPKAPTQEGAVAMPSEEGFSGQPQQPSPPAQ